jgi:hypothetical protein
VSPNSFYHKTRLGISARLALPVDLLDVLVHAHRQPMPTLGAAAFEHLPPIGCGHTRTKAMDAQTTTDFRLIRTLGHFSCYLTQNKIKASRPETLAIFAHSAMCIDEKGLYLKLHFLAKVRRAKIARRT